MDTATNCLGIGFPVKLVLEQITCATCGIHSTPRRLPECPKYSLVTGNFICQLCHGRSYDLELGQSVYMSSRKCWSCNTHRGNYNRYNDENCYRCDYKFDSSCELLWQRMRWNDGVRYFGISEGAASYKTDQIEDIWRNANQIARERWKVEKIKGRVDV